MRFERQQDRDREEKAIKLLCKELKLTYEKLGEHDVDFALYSNDELICYVEVKGRMRNLKEAFPLPISARKLVKLADTQKNSIIVWACYDGIIFSKIRELRGIIKFGGRKPRVGAVNDLEMMVYFKKNYNFKILRYD